METLFVSVKALLNLPIFITLLGWLIFVIIFSKNS